MAPLTTFMLLCLVAIAEGCQDEISSSYCHDMKKLGFCDKNRTFRSKCKKTCGDCPGLSTTTAPVTTPLNPHSGPPPSCGISAIPSERVVAGQNAKPGAWPWQIAMFLGLSFACGGSLVTPEWVITAAHCVDKYKNPGFYTIVLGANDLTKSEKSTQYRKVTTIISHPQYGRLNYDLALLKLDRPAILNDKVRTVCLPKEEDVIPVGTKCYITGWGKIRHPGNSHPILQQTDLPIVDSKTCGKLNSAVLQIPISKQMVCAGHGPYDRKGGCHGDSGGPLVCQYGHGNAFVLHGAVSWGSPRCYTGDAYTVFARITSFRKWIAQYIQL